jgi:hypothetical protein
MDSVKAKAHRAGAIYLLFLVVGLIDMFGFSHFVAPGDASATARNIVAAETTYRLGILTDFVTLLIFIFLIVSLYNLLKDIDRWYAMLMVLLVGAGITLGLSNLFNKIAPLVLLKDASYLSVFTKPQIDALVLSFLRLNSRGDSLTSMFWGLWLFPFGILVIKSNFFPRILGVLLLIAGFGYLAGSVASIILPAHENFISQVTMPFTLGEFPIIFWLLIKGARAPLPLSGA